MGLKPRWGSVPMDGVFPLCPTLDTAGPMARSVADVALLWSVLTGRPVPEPRLAGLTVGLLRRPPSSAPGLDVPTSDAVDGWTTRLQELGARVVEAGVPEPAADTWPLFLDEAARSHAATFPSRADEYSDNCRTSSTSRSASSRTPSTPRAAPSTSGDATSRASTSTSRPASRSTCRRRTATSEIRLPLTAFLRWVNLIGWAGLAIGNLQLVAPRDETVLAAGLAWERG